jgi:hypothetical protein
MWRTCASGKVGQGQDIAAEFRRNDQGVNNYALARRLAALAAQALCVHAAISGHRAAQGSHAGRGLD